MSLHENIASNRTYGSVTNQPHSYEHTSPQDYSHIMGFELLKHKGYLKSQFEKYYPVRYASISAFILTVFAVIACALQIILIIEKANNYQVCSGLIGGLF